MIIAFVICYIAVLFSYFITRTRDNFKHRIINKIILAGMYLIFGIVVFFLKHEFFSLELLLVVSLLLAALGDIFLPFDFKKGGLFFLSGNLGFAAYEIIQLITNGVSFVSFFWVYLIVGAMILTFILLSNKYPDIIKLGKMKIPMIGYLTSIFVHGMTGVAMIIFLKDISFIIMGIGSLLFMISDMILTIDRFVIKGNKWIVRSNSLTYFVGMLLISLSLFV